MCIRGTEEGKHRVRETRGGYCGDPGEEGRCRPSPGRGSRWPHTVLMGRAAWVRMTRWTHAIPKGKLCMRAPASAFTAASAGGKGTQLERGWCELRPTYGSGASLDCHHSQPQAGVAPRWPHGTWPGLVGCPQVPSLMRWELSSSPASPPHLFPSLPLPGEDAGGGHTLPPQKARDGQDEK